MNQALHHALFGFSCWMHSVGLRAYHCAALEYQGPLEVSSEHEKNFRGRPNSKKEIRAHDDRPLSGIKGINSDLLTYRLGKMLRNHANHEAGDAISFCIVAVSSGHSRCT